MPASRTTAMTHVARDLALRSRIGASLYFLAIASLGLWTGQLKTQPVLMAIFLALALALGVWRHLILLEATGPEPNRPGWRARFWANVLLNGLNWAGFAISVALQGTTSTPFLMVIIGTAGFTLGGAVTLAPDKKLVLAFLVTTLLPIAVVCGLVIGGEAVNLTILIVIYLLFCLSVTRSLNQEYWALLDANLTLKESAEKLRAAKNTAEAATQAKSEFLATMSHELRTPMNGVIGMADLLLERPLDEEGREFAQIIKNSGEQLLMVINDILDYSKLEAGKLQLETAPFSPLQVLLQTLDMLAQQAQAKDLELVFQASPSLPPSLLGDVVRLQQILLNLLTNAIKFTSQGQVVLAASWEPVTSGQHTLVLEVRDTGLGIDQAQQASIFQPFTQADSSTTRRFGGTGLGLSIVTRLVAVMDGQLTLQSKLGEGSTFQICLPLVVDPAPHEESLPRSLSKPEPVLTLTHHAATQEALKLALGPHVIPVHSLEDLTRVLGETPVVDSLVVDRETLVLQSPAREAMLQLQNALPLGTPVVILERWTASDSVVPTSPHWQRIRKPFSPHTLAAALHLARNPDITTSTHPAPLRDLQPNTDVLVLVVEDNPFNQKVIMHQLSALGCTVELASNGSEALSAVASRDFDLVFMDCQMPVMDGFEATAEIRKLPHPRGQVPIVALTANVLSGNAQECLAAGMDLFLAKPIKKEELVKVLAQLGSTLGTVSTHQSSI